MSEWHISEFKKHRLYKYLISFIIIAIATLIQKLLWPFLAPSSFVIFYPAIVIACFYGDGYSAILMALVSSQYFFIHPYEVFYVDFPQDVLRLTLFFISGAIVRTLVNRLILAKLESESAVESLQEEKELRESFVSALTHDLQTPLSALKISTEMLIKNKDDPQTRDKYSQKILSNINRIEHMVRDLLDANRVRAGKNLALNFEELDVCEIIFETINGLVSIHGPRFQLNIPSKVMGYWSKDSIQRILENLCQNAIKYGDQNAPITVTLETESTGVVLTIHNVGNPITPNELKVLFNPHERARASQDSEKKGWGLGLTLVKGLTESMGGSVSVKSDVLHGTDFIVFLPYRSGPVIQDT